MDTLKTGLKIEDFTVTLTDGVTKKLSDLLGTQGLVLYFYPKDDTPGCTTQACDFRDRETDLKGLGYNVVGVSGDDVISHKHFANKYKLKFQLIADVDRKLMRALGVYGEKKIYGRLIQGIIRTTFVLDNSLKIIRIYKNIKAKGHVQRVLEELIR